jgi:hypothetical protein
MAPVASVASSTASMVCADGSLVLNTRDCPSAATSSSLFAFRTSPLPATVTSAAGNGDTVLNNMIANAVSALSNVQGLSGDLLSTVMSDVASALSAANGFTSSVLASNGAFDLVSSAGAVGGNIVSTLAGVAVSAANGITSVGNNLATITGAPIAVTGVGGAAAVNTLSPLPGVAVSAGNGIASASNAVAGNGVAEAGNIIGNIETVVNGAATLLPIVRTVLNGKATTVPAVNTIVNGAPSLLPVVNDGGGLLAGLNSGESASGVGSVKGRKRAVNRVMNMPPELAYS